MKLRETSVSLWFGLLLSFTGGMMDAYSFLARGEVFSNAQTGNFLLMSVNAARGDWRVALTYLFPIVAFAAGVFASYTVQNLAARRPFAWDRTVLIVNGVLIAATAWIPKAWDPAACALLSLTCGVQLASFRKTAGIHAATTMCIGNLQQLIRSLTDGMFGRDRSLIRTAGVYALVIAAFCLGAVAQSALLRPLGLFAVCACGALSALLGIIKPKEKE